MQTVFELHRHVEKEGRQILRWWKEHVLQQDGLFYGRVSNDCTIKDSSELSVILATRILWTFSRAVTSEFEPSDENRRIAHSTWQFCKSSFWDELNLGVFWMKTQNEQSSRFRKHIYAQAFAIYALAEYYAATRDYEALLFAQLLYQCIERYAKDSTFGGYLESFSQTWNPVLDQLGMSDLVAPKSMNTHLHLMEAYTRLYQVWPNPDLRNQLVSLLSIMMTRIVDKQTGHFILFFDRDWRPLTHVVSFGHDIEGSWLLCEAAEATGDQKLIQEAQDVAVRMVDATIREGLDTDGGLFYEGENGIVTNHDKHWWPQAEAVVGLFNAYELTHDVKYLELAYKTWMFIEEFIVDRNYGEWYWLVHRDGTPDLSKWKVDPWKCPYHNARACIEIWNRSKSTGRVPDVKSV